MGYIVIADCVCLSLLWTAQVDRSRENAKNMRYVGSRWFKVIEFSTNRTGIYDFLLVTNSNFGDISHVRSYGDVNVENRPSYLMPSLGVMPCKYADEPYARTRFDGL